jgi:hypothetical protein
MFNSLKDLDKVIKEKKIVIKYPAGYKAWKTKFDASLKKTHNVIRTLDEIHGKNNK